MLCDCLVEFRKPGKSWDRHRALVTNGPQFVLAWARCKAEASSWWLEARVRIRAHDCLPYQTLWDSTLDGQGQWTMDQLLEEVTGHAQG